MGWIIPDVRGTRQFVERPLSEILSRLAGLTSI